MKLSFIFLFACFSCYSQVNDSLLYQLQSIQNDTQRINEIYQTGFNIRNSSPQEAYQLAKLCEQEALKVASPKHLAKSYNLLGILFYKKSNFNKALQFQKKSLVLNKSIGYVAGEALNLTNLGNIYTDLHLFQLAESSYLQALQINNHLNNTSQIARGLINLGVLKFSQKSYEPAIHQFTEALNYAEKEHDYDLMATCHNNIGAILMVQNKLDSALIYLEEGLKIISMTDNEFEMADYYNNIANVYIKKKNFNLANLYIEKSDSVSKQFDYSEAQIEMYHTRSLFHEAQKNYEQAYFWVTRYYSIKDSLRKIDDEAIDFDFDDNQTFQNTIKQHNQSNHTPWHLMMLAVLTIGISLFLIRYKR